MTDSSRHRVVAVGDLERRWVSECTVQLTATPEGEECFKTYLEARA